jgi:hypothetical protein
MQYDHNNATTEALINYGNALAVKIDIDIAQGIHPATAIHRLKRVRSELRYRGVELADCMVYPQDW